VHHPERFTKISKNYKKITYHGTVVLHPIVPKGIEYDTPTRGDAVIPIDSASIDSDTPYYRSTVRYCSRLLHDRLYAALFCCRAIIYQTTLEKHSRTL